MDLIYTILAYGCTVLLAVLGAVVTVKPPKSSCGMRAWIAVFTIVGIASVVGAVQDTKYRDLRLREMLTGGDNYGYIWAEVSAVELWSDPIPLWFKASGLLFGVEYWISPASVSDPNDKRYWSIGGGDIGETRGGMRIGKTLQLGKYRIEFSARNGSFVQILEIKLDGNKLIQNIEVFRHGEGLIYAEGSDVSR
ncbi:MAG: hypothetical protein ISR48_06505 [Alphaproteobacteria bacterium]|nr:hypothetical protein [Alphaproteobacteria bacterium]